MTEPSEVNMGSTQLNTTSLAVIVILGFIGLTSLYMGFQNYGEENEYFMIYMLLGTACFSVIGYLFFRPKTSRKAPEIPKVPIVTVLECSSCNLKRIRDFKSGDYVNKDDEPCTRCDGNMRIVGIHRRKEPERKR